MVRKKNIPFYEGKGNMRVSFSVLIFERQERSLAEMLENNFQSQLIRDIKKRFPDCIVMKNDANYIQGIPDLLILYRDKWASLECKKSAVSKKQANQSYYVDKMNKMSFSRFIFPENKEEVLDELQQSFDA